MTPLSWNTSPLIFNLAPCQTPVGLIIRDD